MAVENEQKDIWNIIPSQRKQLSSMKTRQGPDKKHPRKNQTELTFTFGIMSSINFCPPNPGSTAKNNEMMDIKILFYFLFFSKVNDHEIGEEWKASDR